MSRQVRRLGQRRYLRLVVPLLLVLALVVGAACGAGARTSALGSVPLLGGDPPGVLWGANIGPQLTGGEAPWNTRAIPAFDREAGKKVSLVTMGWPFASCTPTWCSRYAFPYVGLNLVRQAGAIPLVSMSTAVSQGRGDASQFSLGSFARGEWDSWLRQYAQEVKRWGHPFFLRFDWEMNGDWYPYSTGQHNTPAQYVAAWRHIHDIFTQVGATNVSWVWCPNIDYSSQLAQLYPGSRYVDWTCLDGYDRGNGGPSESFDQLYASSYALITQKIAPNKPMMVGEFASGENGSAKARFIAGALAAVPARYPKIRGLVYFDRNDDGGNWDMETDRAAVAAFRSGIANPAYVGNRFGSLSGGVIRPPGR